MPTETEEKLQVTTRTSWKGAQKEGQLVTLPSGNVVRVVRTMDLMHLLKAGKIPNPLAQIVQGMVDRKSTQINPEEIMDMDTLQSTMKFVDEMVLKVVIEPKLLVPPEPEPDEDEAAYALRVEEWQKKIDDEDDPEYNPEAVPLTWMDMDDRMYIFVFSQGFAADLAAFRAAPAEPVAPASNVKATPKPTKRTGGRK